MFHTREFELDLVAHCIKKPLYLKTHKEELGKLKFQDKFIDILYKLVFKCLDKYKTVPTVTELQNMAKEFMGANEKFNFLEIETVQELASEVYVRETTDMTGVSISHYLMETEAKRLASSLTTSKGEELAENINDYKHILAKMDHYFSDDEDLGHNVFSFDGGRRMRDMLFAYNNMSCIPTLYPLLDYCLMGGVRRGELMVILASTNVGKTSSLLNFTANFLRQGLRIVYFCLDNLEEEMVSRTIGCLMNVDITQPIDADEAVEQLNDRFMDHMHNNFWFKHYGPRELTTKKLDRYLERLETYLYETDKAEGIKPEDKWGKIDGIVVDYADVMLPERSENPWESQDHLMQEIKCILKKKNIFGITATQGGTEAMKSDTVKMYQAQGFKNKFNAPDLVFAISQDDSEKALYPSVFRLGCLKARRAKVNYQIQYQFWKERQVIKEMDNAKILTMSTERTEESGAKPVREVDSSAYKPKNLSTKDEIRENLRAAQAAAEAAEAAKSQQESQEPEE